MIYSFLQSNITSPLFRNPCEQNMIPVWFLWKSPNCLLEFLKRIDSLIKHAARNATCLICYPPLGLENIQKDNHLRSMLNKQMKIWTKHMERPNTTNSQVNVTLPLKEIKTTGSIKYVHYQSWQYSSFQCYLKRLFENHSLSIPDQQTLLVSFNILP